MIDHIAIKVSNFVDSKQFYRQALEPLGYQLIMEHDISGAGFGKDGKPDFWIQPGQPGGPIHIAFSCTSRDSVDQFFQLAIQAGGRDNGSPGLRSEYHPTYYGAFVLDPDDNNVEAVCHNPE